MQTENKQPLYKVLNEQRSQGVFYIEDTPLGTGKGFNKQLVTDKALICSFKYHGWNMSKSKPIFTKENIATAEYTALAVNNLANLAEALERINNLLEEGETVSNIQNVIEEALNRIS